LPSSAMPPASPVTPARFRRPRAGIQIPESTRPFYYWPFRLDQRHTRLERPFQSPITHRTPPSNADAGRRG
jgi:hypothetical protein